MLRTQIATQAEDAKRRSEALAKKHEAERSVLHESTSEATQRQHQLSRDLKAHHRQHRSMKDELAEATSKYKGMLETASTGAEAMRRIEGEKEKANAQLNEAKSEVNTLKNANEMFKAEIDRLRLRLQVRVLVLLLLRYCCCHAAAVAATAPPTILLTHSLPHLLTVQDMEELQGTLMSAGDVAHFKQEMTTLRAREDHNKFEYHALSVKYDTLKEAVAAGIGGIGAQASLAAAGDAPVGSAAQQPGQHGAASIGLAASILEAVGAAAPGAAAHAVKAAQPRRFSVVQTGLDEAILHMNAEGPAAAALAAAAHTQAGPPVDIGAAAPAVSMGGRPMDGVPTTVMVAGAGANGADGPSVVAAGIPARRRRRRSITTGEGIVPIAPPIPAPPAPAQAEAQHSEVHHHAASFAAHASGATGGPIDVEAMLGHMMALKSHTGNADVGPVQAAEGPSTVEDRRGRRPSQNVTRPETDPRTEPFEPPGSYFVGHGMTDDVPL